MKRTTTILLAVVNMIISASAQDFEYTYAEQTITYSVADQDVKTCITKAAYNNWYPGNTVTDSLLTIPETVVYNDEVYTVVGIGAFSFGSGNSFTELCLPNTIIEIGDGAFGYCRELRTCL